MLAPFALIRKNDANQASVNDTDQSMPLYRRASLSFRKARFRLDHAECGSDMLASTYTFTRASAYAERASVIWSE
jgi:hypothetical protein